MSKDRRFDWKNGIVSVETPGRVFISGRDTRRPRVNRLERVIEALTDEDMPADQADGILMGTDPIQLRRARRLLSQPDAPLRNPEELSIWVRERI